MIADVLSGAARYHVEPTDCFDFAARIPDGAVNLLWLDGPYNMGKASWDTFSAADFFAFYDRLLAESQRILAPNGSLYLCNSTANGARLECLVASRFTVLNSIRWAKVDAAGEGLSSKACKEELRAFFPQSETIIFAEQQGSDGVAMGGSGYDLAVDKMRGFVFEPLRLYFDGERARSGLTSAQIQEGMFKRTGVRYTFDRHTFSRSQWEMPTREQFDAARDLFNAEGAKPPEYLRKDYEELRKDYEELRRPFSISRAVPFVDTWTYPTVASQAGKHLAEKPAAMLRDVIAASSREGGVVCELFMGSGVGGEQAVLQGRRYLGCDADPEWARRGLARIERAEREPHRAGAPIVAVERIATQGVLL